MRHFKASWTISGGFKDPWLKLVQCTIRAEVISKLQFFVYTIIHFSPSTFCWHDKIPSHQIVLIGKAWWSTVVFVPYFVNYRGVQIFCTIFSSCWLEFSPTLGLSWGINARHLFNFLVALFYIFYKKLKRSLDLNGISILQEITDVFLIFLI